MVRGVIYDAFLGGAEKAFYYGHSYTANQLGAVSALANLDVFEQENTLEKLPVKINLLADRLQKLSSQSAFVFDIRQCGMVAGVEIRLSNGEKFPTASRVGEKISVLARRYQLLIRPILDTLVLIPPLSISVDEIHQIMRTASTGDYKDIIAYNDEPLVSIDFNHHPASAIYEATETKVIGKLVKVLAWYDNEWGFSCRMLDTASAMF